MKKTAEYQGWGMRVGGSTPYLTNVLFHYKEGAQKQMTESYHRAVRLC